MIKQVARIGLGGEGIAARLAGGGIGIKASKIALMRPNLRMQNQATVKFWKNEIELN